MKCQYVQVIEQDDSWFIGFTDNANDPDYALRDGTKPKAVVPFRRVVEPLFFVRAAADELENVGHHDMTHLPEELWADMPIHETPEQALDAAKKLFFTLCPDCAYMDTTELRGEGDQVCNLNRLPSKVLAKINLNNKLNALGEQIKEAYIEMAKNNDPDFHAEKRVRINDWFEQMCALHEEAFG